MFTSSVIASKLPLTLLFCIYLTILQFFIILTRSEKIHVLFGVLFSDFDQTKLKWLLSLLVDGDGDGGGILFFVIPSSTATKSKKKKDE